jgi:hypothetical protein
VSLDGEITQLIQFGNIVPTGLETSGKRVYMGEAGPIPHLPQNGKVVTFRPGDAIAEDVASGAPPITDVEFGRCTPSPKECGRCPTSPRTRERRRHTTRGDYCGSTPTAPSPPW